MRDKLERIYWECYGPRPTGKGRRPVAFKNREVLVYIWQNYNLSDRERNFIFKLVHDSYVGYVWKRFFETDSYYDKQHVLQNFKVMVLHCLDTYLGINKRTGASAKFTTYLHFSIKRVIPNYFEIEKTNGSKNKNKEISFDPVLFQDVSDWEEFAKMY